MRNIKRFNMKVKVIGLFSVDLNFLTHDKNNRSKKK